MTRLLSWTLGLASFAVVSGCDAERREPLQISRSTIEGGADDSADTGVVLLYTSTLNEYCTGALLAPNLVLTAAHCVDTKATSGQTCSAMTFGQATEPTELLFSAAAEAPMFTTDYIRASEIFPYPQPGQSLCGADLALVILKYPLEGATPLVPRIDEAPVVGEVFAAIGYGGTDAQATNIGARRRLDGLEVVCATSDCQKPYSALPEWIGNPAAAHTGGRPGDSGSPAIDEEGRVLGMFVRHLEYPDTSQEKDVLVYESLETDVAWLTAGARAAATAGGYDAAPWVDGWPTDPRYTGEIGGPCDDSCNTGLCVDDVCTRACNDAAPCPDDATCEATTDPLTVCVPKTEEPPPQGGAGPSDPSDPDPSASDGCALTSGASSGCPLSLTLLGIAGLGWAARRRRSAAR
ncbi:MAG: trypsin-like peptidase domain-containing protein [Polyangiaceae bacterium]